MVTSVGITDNNQIYRGKHYFIEHADNPHYINPTIVPLGQPAMEHVSRQRHTIFQGILG